MLCYRARASRGMRECVAGRRAGKGRPRGPLVHGAGTGTAPQAAQIHRAPGAPPLTRKVDRLTSRPSTLLTAMAATLPGVKA